MLLVYNRCTLASLTPDRIGIASLNNVNLRVYFSAWDGYGLVHELPDKVGDEAGWGIKDLGMGLVWYLRTVVLRLFLCWW